MVKLNIIMISFCMLLLLNFACNQSSDQQDETEELDYPGGKNGHEVTDFDEMDKKMRHIMNERTSAEEEGPYKEIRIIKAYEAKEVNVSLKIGAGKLRLTGGASELLIAGFVYSDETWKPLINYNVIGNTGKLLIEQPESEDYNFDNEDKYIWNLKFNSQIPLDFDIELGAGLSEIFLSDLNIQDFSMLMGVGKSEIDLRGNWEKSTTMHLVGGIGLTRIYLPQNVGIVLNIDNGLGAMDIHDLIQKSRTQYVNKLYDTAEIILTINVKSGIGKIEIE